MCTVKSDLIVNDTFLISSQISRNYIHLFCSRISSADACDCIRSFQNIQEITLVDSFYESKSCIVIAMEFACICQFVDRSVNRVIQVNQEFTCYIAFVRSRMFASWIDSVLWTPSISNCAIRSDNKHILRHTRIYSSCYFVYIQSCILSATGIRQRFDIQIVQ